MTTRLARRPAGRAVRRLPLLLAAVALVPALTACGSQEGSTPPRPAVTATDSPATPETTPWADRIAMSSVDLVTIKTIGGMCVDGNGEGIQCGTITTIAGDGSWKVVDETGKTRTGRLGFEDLTGLTGTLYATDATKHPKAETECDSWVDGRDVTLTYASATGEDVTVSSCEYDLSGVKLLDRVAVLTAA